MKLNLGAGKVKREGFTSVDKFSMPEVDIQMDLFSFPWDFPGDSVDEFFMSHIVEHIPHEPKKADMSSFISGNYVQYEQKKVWWEDRWASLKSYDGFFCWFAEVWRIGKPGTKATIISPYGMSYSALQDPTHTRYLVQPSFSYLTAEAQQSVNWDYHLPFLFKINYCTVSMHPAYCQNGYNDNINDSNSQYDLNNTLFHQWNIGHEIQVEIEIIKCKECGQPHDTNAHPS